MIGTIIEAEEAENTVESANIITEQPKKQEKFVEILEGIPISSPEDKEAWKFHGLSSLAVTDSILIMVDSKCCRCDWDVHYSFLDGKSDNSNTLMFTAIEELHCCYLGSIQNVVIRDLQNLAVARVCYKEKSCFSKKMILAVYAPPDLLVGTAEQDSGFCFSSKTDFKIFNSDGRLIFYVEYRKARFCGCRPIFSVKSEDRETEVAKILEKTETGLRLQFNIKMGIRNKILLSGFCLGLIHKPYNQKSEDGKEGYE